VKWQVSIPDPFLSSGRRRIPALPAAITTHAGKPCEAHPQQEERRRLGYGAQERIEFQARIGVLREQALERRELLIEEQ